MILDINDVINHLCHPSGKRKSNTCCIINITKDRVNEELFHNGAVRQYIVQSFHLSVIDDNLFLFKHTKWTLQWLICRIPALPSHCAGFCFQIPLLCFPRLLKRSLEQLSWQNQNTKLGSICRQGYKQAKPAWPKTTESLWELKSICLSTFCALCFPPSQCWAAAAVNLDIVRGKWRNPHLHLLWLRALPCRPGKYARKKSILSKDAAGLPRLCKMLLKGLLSYG